MDDNKQRELIRIMNQASIDFSSDKEFIQTINNFNEENQKLINVLKDLKESNIKIMDGLKYKIYSIEQHLSVIDNNIKCEAFINNIIIMIILILFIHSFFQE